NSLLEDTANRISPLVNKEDIYVVVGKNHAKLTDNLIGGMGVHILTEPIGRNTAAAIGLAAVHIARLDENAPMFVLPSDHFIADTDGFIKVLRAAAEAAKSGSIVTLGITPTRPETGYGYIESGKAEGEALSTPFFAVNRFVEKPDLETALKYLASGNYFWNSGIFIFTPKTILAEIERSLPNLYAGLHTIAKAIGKDSYDRVLESVYSDLESVSIDYGVMERAKAPINVFKADFGWSDVGSWQALYELRREEYDDQQNLLLADALAIDSKNNLVYSNKERLIALLGVEGLVIVDTPDGLLIADMNRSQDVKKFPEMLK